jgi:hypothetical protein
MGPKAGQMKKVMDKHYKAGEVKYNIGNAQKQ